MATMTTNVVRGFWQYYAASSFFTRYRYATSESSATEWSNFMVVLGALVYANLLRVFMKIVLSLFRNENNGHRPDARLPLLPQAGGELNGRHHIRDIFPPALDIQYGAAGIVPQLKSSAGTILRALRATGPLIWRQNRATLRVGRWYTPMLGRLSVVRDNIRREWNKILLLSVIVVVAIVCFAAQTSLGIFNGTITLLDNKVLSHNPACGLPLARAGAGGLPFVLRNINQETERDAAGYARVCSDQAEGKDGCNKFVHHPPIIKVYHNQPSPFAEEITSNIGSGAIRITTDLTPAWYLGINSPNPFQMNCTFTCVPLNSSGNFITPSVIAGVPVNLYNYGEFVNGNSSTNYTWYSTKGNTDSTGTYSAKIFQHATSGTLAPAGWIPHPMLNHSSTQKLTLMLITSNHVWHTAPRLYDPVFPTDSSRVYPGPPSVTYFTDTTQQGHPLACLEIVDVCTPDGLTCRPLQAGPPDPAAKGNVWPASALPRDMKSRAALYLMYDSLERFDLYRSIANRAGSGLVASEVISQALSSPLAPEHWKDEVIRLVQTVLAGWSGVVHDISRGTWTNLTTDPALGVYNSFDNITDPAFREAICQLYVIPGQGWKNVNVLGSIVLGLFQLLMFLAGLECDDKIKIFRPLGTFFVQILGKLWELPSEIVGVGRGMRRSANRRFSSRRP